MPDGSNERSALDQALEAAWHEGGTVPNARLEEILGEMLGTPGRVVVARRKGTQLKANAMWNGAWPPSHESAKSLGVAIATNSPMLAVQGAVARLTLDAQRPDVLVLLAADDTGVRVATICAYDDADLAASVARAFGVPEASVVRVPRLSSTVVRRNVPTGATDTDRLAQHIGEALNVVLQGPPGTGKTTAVLTLLATLAGGERELELCNLGRLLDEYDQDVEALGDALRLERPPLVWEMIQMHPAYTYDDLVRTVVPAGDGETLRFLVEDRLLPVMCRVADAVRATDEAPAVPVVLVMDEINRCDLSTVLGEFLVALDPAERGLSIRLQYQGQTGSGEYLASSVSAPDNLFVVGTMNTADRSIALVDYAVRRRFRFLEVVPDVEVVRHFYGDRTDRADVAVEAFAAFNDGLAPERGIGHGVFLVHAASGEDQLWAERFARRMAYEAWPMLREYTAEGLRAEAPVRFRGTPLPGDEAAMAAYLAERLVQLLSGS